ncbi:chymotrypsin-1-like [Cloeon dipterum]|uniref:chymotrypsin-1-like n=1 Tax=Cloeon dipterum TaxID=197152 RepID=UPI00322015F2
MWSLFVLGFSLQVATCQISTSADSSGQVRVVNGTDVPAGKYPAQVSLRYRNSHTCGGSIIGHNLVLTAAHCVDDRTAQSLSVLAGTLDVYDEAKEGKVHQVTEVIVHENYSSMYIRHDIALLKISPSFEFGDLIDSISLPVPYQQTMAAEPATVVGWGYDKSGGSVMRRLQEAELLVYSDEECFDIHGSNMVYPNNICAGVPGGGRGQCSGDSGGPLVVDGQLVGIVSWSRKPCAVPPFPGVFTQVSPYIKWIQSQINIYSNK